MRKTRMRPCIHEWNREKREAGGDVTLYLSSKPRDIVEEERVLHGNRLTPERFLEHRSFNSWHQAQPYYNHGTLRKSRFPVK